MATCRHSAAEISRLLRIYKQQYTLVSAFPSSYSVLPPTKEWLPSHTLNSGVSPLLQFTCASRLW